MSTPEQIAVCVTAVALLALAVWALSSRAEWKRKATDRGERIACLRVERDTLKASNERLNRDLSDTLVEAEELRDELGEVTRGVELAHLVLAAADTEHVEADPAGAMPRVAPNERGR